MHKIFRYSDFCEGLKWCPRTFSAPSDQKLSTEKRDTPLFIHKNFRHQNFTENSTIPLRSFSALWDKIFSTEFSDIAFLCIKFCDTRIFLKHRTVPQWHFSVLCDKSIRGRNVIPLRLWCIKLDDTSTFWNIEGMPTQFFGTVTPKSSDGKTWYPLSHKNFFVTKVFPGKQKGSFTKLFVSVLWDKKIWQNRDAPPLMHENFRIWKFFETQKCSPMKFFGNVRRKLFDEKPW